MAQCSQSFYSKGVKMEQRTKSTRLSVVFAIGLGLFSVYLVQLGPAHSSAALAQAGQDKPFDQNQAIADLNKKIVGQESKPAGEVFKNIQILKAIPAGRLLKVMELGYAKSLGVNCEHCHVAGEWEKDDKPTKQIARDMVGMSNTINSQLLKNIKNLKGPNSIVNCTTCHRGQTKPALNLATPEKKEG